MDEMTSNDTGASESNAAPADTGGDWRSSLPPELKDNPSLRDVQDVASLAKQFVDTKAMVGNSLRVPSTEAGQDDIKGFVERILQNDHLGLMHKPDLEDADSVQQVYNALGRPEDTSGYQPAEGVDPEAFGALAPTAHELGLTKSQFEGLTARHAQLVQEHVTKVSEERKAGLAQLQGEWGLAYNEKTERALKMVQQLGGHHGLEDAIAQGMVDAPTLRLLDTIATQMGSEGTPMAQQMNQINQSTPDELRQKRDEITRRLISEDLTPRQREDLIKKNINISEQLSATG